MAWTKTGTLKSPTSQTRLAAGGNLIGAATLAADTFYTVDGSIATGGFTLTLPAAPAQGTQITLWRTDTATKNINVSPGGTDTIADANPWQIYRGAGGVSFYYVGTTWYPEPIIGGISGLTARASSSAVGGAIAIRDGNANLQVGTATVAGHAANKGYVDATTVRPITATANYNAVAGDFVIADASGGGTLAITLPDQAATRMVVRVRRVDASTLGTVTVTSAAPLDGSYGTASSMTLNPGDDVEFVWNNAGLNWYVSWLDRGNPLLQIPTFQNSWVQYTTTSYATTGYYIDSDGVVHLQGMVQGGNISTSLSIFVLPAGYRPAKTHIFTCPVGAGSTNTIGQTRVTSAGQVLPYVLLGSGTYASNSGYWGLDGISFLVNN